MKIVEQSKKMVLKSDAYHLTRTFGFGANEPQCHAGNATRSSATFGAWIDRAEQHTVEVRGNRILGDQRAKKPIVLARTLTNNTFFDQAIHFRRFNRLNLRAFTKNCNKVK